MTTRDIKVLRELAKKKQTAKQLSLHDKITKQYGQATLQETFKPILTAQEEQKQETKKQTEKETERLTKQQQVIDEVRNIPTALAQELKKQQIIVPLIKSLSHHPNIISVLRGESDGNKLTEDEQYILNELGHIDNKTLLMLINSFNNKTEEIDTFVTPPPAKPEPQPPTSELPGYTKIPNNIKTDDELGNWLTVHFISKRDFRKPDENKKYIKDILTNGLEDRSADELKQGLKAHVAAVKNVASVNFGEYPWSTIRAVNAEFYESLRKIKTPKSVRTQSVSSMRSLSTSTPRATGVTTKFLTSDPSELLKKLEILHAEKAAGNNNVLNEASAIADELRRQGMLTATQLKDISKSFNN